MGQDVNSLFADPRLKNDKLGITSVSPCIDKGMDLGLKEDYFGNPVPMRDGVDIGPFEYQADNKFKQPVFEMSE